MKIKHNITSSLITGTLVGVTLGYYLTDGIPPQTLFNLASGNATHFMDRSRLPVRLAMGGVGLLGVASYFTTRNMLTLKGEQRLYNLSYMYLFSTVLFSLTSVCVSQYIDARLMEKRDFSIGIFTIPTTVIATYFGGKFGYKYGHRMWQIL